MIEVGAKAPQFTLPNQDGEEVARADFSGRTVVLYFYPKANTRQAVAQLHAALRRRPRGVRRLRRLDREVDA